MAQPWHNHVAPRGWQGQWPPPAGMPMPPGFPGPPPVPHNVPVQPSAWQAGYWQFNPRVRNSGIQYPNAQPSNGPGPWAPSNHWGNQAAAQQQNQDYNPHKKIPRPPDASYYNYALVDNPLGLEGMVPRDESRHSHQGDGPQTPWIWNPPTLRESNERPVASRDYPHSRSSMDAGQSNGQSRVHNRSASAGNHGKSDFNEKSLADVQRREANTLPDMSRHRPLNMNPLFGTQMPAGFVPQQQPMSQQPASHQSASHQPVPRSAPAHSHSGPQQGSGQPAHQHTVRKSESFTEKKELHPTFSPQIVRTPDYYHRKNLDATNASTASRQAHIYRPSGGVNKIYIDRSRNAIDEMNGVLGNEPSAQPLERHSSLPASLPSSSSASSTITGLSGYTEEPSSLLSPVIGATPKASIGQIRSRTDPPLVRANTLSTIPESSSSHSGGSRSMDIGLAPLSAPQDNAVLVPLQPTRSRHPTPHPRRENPLPPPPVDIQRSVPSPQSQPPAHYSRKVRKGFWNRRGDYLTSDMHIVYAPPGKTYPAELARYPDGKEGYYDAHLNQHVPWIEDRPELPASLPHRGRPPTQPYESFVVYAYIP